MTDTTSQRPAVPLARWQRLLPRRFGLQGLLVVLMLLATVPVLLVVVGASLLQQNVLEERARRNLAVLAEVLAANQAHLFEGATEVLASVSNTTAVTGDADACNQYLARLRTSLPTYSNIGIINNRGYIKCRSLPLAVDTYVGDRAYFRKVVQTGTLALGDFIMGRTTGDKIISLATPVKDDDGSLRGVAYIAINLKTLHEKLGGVTIPAGVRASVTDAIGTVLADVGGNAAIIGTRLDDPVLLAAVLRGQSGLVDAPAAEAAPPFRAVKRIRVSANDSLYVSVSASYESVLAPVVRARMLQTGAILAILAVCASAIWLLGNSLLVRPLHGLLESMRLVELGNFKETLALRRSLLRELAMVQLGLKRMTRTIERRRIQRDQALAQATNMRNETVEVLDRMSDGFVVLDQDWKLRYLNQQAIAMLQKGHDDSNAGSFWSLLPDEADGSIRRACERTLKKGRVADFEQFYAKYARWFELRVFATADGIGVFLHDSTERHQTLDALREREARYRELFDASPQVMWVFNAQTLRFMAVNDAAVLRYGYSRESFLGMTLADVHLEEDLPALKAELGNEAAAGTQSELGRIWRHRMQDGEVMLVEVMVRPIAFDGQRANLALVSIAGERLLVESRLRRANQQMTRILTQKTRELDLAEQVLESFSYLVSHDLRAPLQVVDGFARELELGAGGLDESGRHDVARIRAAARHMGQLIEDMLLLHRVTRTPLQSEVVDLSRICDNVIQGLREREPARNVTIEVDRDMQTVGDPKLLELALSHLISNAWKFSANRADAWIKIGHKSLPGQHEEVFFVSDNGAGFDMAYADKLFVAFQRLHSTLQFPGTGVGLAIVQRVVARHGGEIWAESQPGMGSTFYFTLSGAEDNELELEVYHHVTE